MTDRPGGWVDGIGWVVNLREIPDGTVFRYDAADRVAADVGDAGWRQFDPYPDPVVVARWADGTVPEAPARPDTTALRATAAAVERAFPNAGSAMRDSILAAADYIDGVTR